MTAQFAETILEIGFAGAWNSATMAWNAPRATQKTPKATGYVDVSEFLTNWDVSLGQRSSSLDPFEAATATFTVLNSDARFTPQNGFSPYAPYVRPGRKIRFGIKWASTIDWLFTGFVDSWDPDVDVPGYAKISCSDGLALLAGQEFPKRNDDRNRIHLGTWNGITDTYTETDAFVDPDEAIAVYALVEAAPYQGELWCDDFTLRLKYTNGAGTSGRHTFLSFKGTPDDATRKYYTDLAGSDSLRSLGHVKVSHGTAQFSKFLVRFYGVPALIPHGRSDLQLERLLDAAEWPAGDRQIVAGSESLIRTSPWGSDYMSEIRSICASELGAAKILGDGRFANEGRKTRYQAWATSGADFTLINPNIDDLVHGQHDPIPFDIPMPRRSNEKVINRAIITRTGLGSETPPQQKRENYSSQSEFGIRTYQNDSRVVTNERAAQQAQWIVDAFNWPRDEIAELTLKPLIDPALIWPMIGTVSLSSRLQVALWLSKKNAWMGELNVEGISHTGGDGVKWETKLVLSPRVGTVPY